DVDVATQILTVTWDDVGSFFSGNTPNAFQLQLINTGNGDFDVVFRYENIDWADSPNASAGIAGGDGSHFFALPGSGTNSVGAYDTSIGNTGAPGVWEFQVHNGEITTVSHTGSDPITVNS